MTTHSSISSPLPGTSPLPGRRCGQNLEALPSFMKVGSTCQELKKASKKSLLKMGFQKNAGELDLDWGETHFYH